MWTTLCSLEMFAFLMAVMRSKLGREDKSNVEVTSNSFDGAIIIKCFPSKSTRDGGIRQLDVTYL